MRSRSCAADLASVGSSGPNVRRSTCPRSTRVTSARLPRSFATCGPADGSGASFSQRNLFELAVDRLAAEFAAVVQDDKAAAVEWLHQTLHEAETAGGASAHDPGDFPGKAIRTPI